MPMCVLEELEGWMSCGEGAAPCQRGAPVPNVSFVFTARGDGDGGWAVCSEPDGFCWSWLESWNHWGWKEPSRLSCPTVQLCPQSVHLTPRVHKAARRVSACWWALAFAAHSGTLSIIMCLCLQSYRYTLPKIEYSEFSEHVIYRGTIRSKRDSESVIYSL